MPATATRTTALTAPTVLADQLPEHVATDYTGAATVQCQACRTDLGPLPHLLTPWVDLADLDKKAWDLVLAHLDDETATRDCHAYYA